MDNKLATVDLICVDGPHVERGRNVPDTYGALKLIGGRWAYCSAARPEEPHAGRDTVAWSRDIRHEELPNFPKPRAT